MAIPPAHSSRHLYHYLHLDNLPGILEHGLLAVNEQNRRGIRHFSIAARDIQITRSRMTVTCPPGGVVHDYVPLYFCKLSSMFLSVVNSKNFDQPLLIYFEFPISILDRPNTVFTDAAANTAGEPPAFYSDPSDLQHLNWDAIDSLKWSVGSDELNHQRMAEVLVHAELPISDVSRIITWNKATKEPVINAYKHAGLEPPPIAFASRGFYVTKFAEGKPAESLVTGPRLMLDEFRRLTKDVCDALDTDRECSFERLCDLRNAMRVNLSNVPATAELVDLATSNPYHSQTVGDHTLQVVANLHALPEFSALDRTDRLLTEIAAYLHDVGKGPKNRWANRGGVHRHPDADHPVQGLRIVAELLRSDVEQMHKRSVRVILMLVCYHDLIGGITNRGRHKQQLFDVVTDMRDFDMLAALSKADSQALSDEWWDDEAVAELREEVQAHLDGDDSDDDDEELDV